MAVELRNLAQQYRNAGLEEAALHFEKEADEMENSGLLTHDLKTTERKLSREEEVIQLADKLRVVGANLDGSVYLRDLLRERGVQGGKRLIPSRGSEDDKYPEWTKALEDLAPKDLQLVSSSIHNAIISYSGKQQIKSPFERVEDIRNEEKRRELRGKRDVGYLRSLFLSRVFAPISE